ncbi:MAG: hypothetical protein ABIW49_07525 [Knoellia sp.]
MKINTVVRCAVTATIATLALTACGGTSEDTDAQATTKPSVSSPSPRASAAPKPSPTVHTQIAPLLAATEALIKRDPSVGFDFEDTMAGDPWMGAGGELLLGKELEGRVAINDAEGHRDVVVVDRKAYATDGAASLPTWRVVDLDETRAEFVELAVHRLVPALRAGVTSLKHAGLVEEAGTSFSHYTFTADTKKTFDAMDLEPNAKDPRQIAGELWLRADSGDLSRVLLKVGEWQHDVDVQYGIAPNIVAPPL